MISYVAHNKIDATKWNTCIHQSENGLIYHQYEFLKQMAGQWDALILHDYEFVMPLTWRRKLGIRYLYQPAFLQQGGIVSNQPVTPEIFKLFMDALQSAFKFAEITLNYGNNHLVEDSVLTKQTRNNYLLPLMDRYEIIESFYSTYLRQRINRSKKNHLCYENADGDFSVIKLYKKLYGDRLPFIKHNDYTHLETFCKKWGEKGQVIIRKIYEEESKQLLAAVLLLKDEKRIYNLISCILPEGKKKLANYFLYDQLIKEFSGSKLILDFEGSDVPGIAYFYEKFSVINQLYPFIRINLLPAPLKWLK